MKEIIKGMNKLNFDNSREDRLFIQVRVTKQYLDQYSGIYPTA